MKVLIAISIAIFCFPADANAQGAYEGQIDGVYKGWTGDTIYKLRDGHIIQQKDYHYHYHYAFSPDVIIYKSKTGVLMIHVLDDDDDDVSITILK